MMFKSLSSMLVIGTASAMSLAEIETHVTSDDCWMTIKGSVYDVSNWMPKHPGGKAILTRHCGKDATQTFTNIHPKGLAAMLDVAGTLVKEIGSLDKADQAVVGRSAAKPARNRDFVTDESNLSPFAKTALHAVHEHAIVKENKYAEWFGKGEAGLPQIKDLIVQFSVFSQLFLQAQLRKVLNAPSLHEMREGKEILANELGVVFNSEQGSGRRDEQAATDTTEYDPDIVSTSGTVEGGVFSHRAAHFEWLLSVADSVDLKFADVGKRKHGTNATLFFCDQLYNLYGSDDLSTSLGASFAIEHWANAGFWDDLVDGFTTINEKGTAKMPLGFWLFHQALEGQHAAHTMDELEEAIEGNKIEDEGRFLAAANEILEAVAVFWDGMYVDRVALGGGLKSEL